MRSCLLFCFCLFCACTSPIYSSAQEDSQKTIVIAAFGTSIQSGTASYANINDHVAKAFPKAHIYWTWTAHSLLNSSPEKVMLSPQQMFANLATQGVKDVIVLPLHIIPGAEYSGLCTTANAFEGLPKGIKTISVCQPLLYNNESLNEVAKALTALAPAKRKPTEALLFVGHGTHHNAEVYYPALQFFLQQHDPNAYVGTIEGALDLETTLATLKKNKVTSVWLMPLMTVAGDHAANDIMGSDSESWQSQLQHNGITVHAVQKGLGEYPEFAAIWLKRLSAK